MKNKLKNAFLKEKLYVSLNSSNFKIPLSTCKNFHPITKNQIIMNKTDQTSPGNFQEKLLERKNGTYKISSKRNFKTIIFQNWNTKRKIPTDLGDYLNYPVILDRKKILRINSVDGKNDTQKQYEYYYPVSNRKDLLTPNEEKGVKKKKKNLKKIHSQDKGWKLITSYFYKNKHERDLQKKKLQMKLTAKNLSVYKNKINNNKNIPTEINNEKTIDNNLKEKNTISEIEDDKSSNISKSNKELLNNISIKSKSKKTIKAMDIEKIQESRKKLKNSSKNSIPFTINKNENTIQKSGKASEISEMSEKYEDSTKNMIFINQKKPQELNFDLNKSIDWETFDKYKYLHEDEFLYAIRFEKPLSYYLIEFEELKKINDKEMNEKYNNHQLNKKSTYLPKHSHDVFITNYLTVSSENVIIYAKGVPESYSIGEFKKLYINYKALCDIPLFKFWTRSKIFKLWLKYVQRQRRKIYEKQLSAKLYILDKPIVGGIIKIRKVLENLTDMNIFKLNQKYATYPNQFVIDYHKDIVRNNRDFESFRNKVKDFVAKMCEEEVKNFLVEKKIEGSLSVLEDYKLSKKIAENNKNNNNILESTNNLDEINKSIKSKDKNIEISVMKNTNNNNNKKEEILTPIPKKLTYTKPLTKDEIFHNKLNAFIKNETPYAQDATKKDFYCKILRIIRLIDHFLNEAKRKTVYNSLIILNKKIERYYEVYMDGGAMPPLLKLTLLTLEQDVQYIPDLLSLDELIFEKFIQENIFSFINKKNLVDPQEFPIYMVCFEEVFEKSFDQNIALLNRIKTDTEINYLINNIRNIFYKIGGELNKKIDELKVMLINYLKYSKINFKEFEKNSTPQKIQEYFNYVYTERNKTINLKRIIKVGIFELDTEQLLELLTSGPEKYLKRARDAVPRILKKKQKNLINKLNENINSLSLNVKNVEDFIKVKNGIEICKKTQNEINDLKNEIMDYIYLIDTKRNRISVDQDVVENQSKMYVLNIQYDEVYEKISNEIEVKSKIFRNTLIENIKKFDKKIDEIEEKLNTEILNKNPNDQDYFQVNEILIDLESSFKFLKEQKCVFEQQAKEFELDEEILKRIKSVDKLAEEFELKNNIWSKYQEFKNLTKELQTKEATKINIKEIQEKINEYISLCENAKKKLYNFELPNVFLEKIEPLKEIISILTVIQNPNIENSETKFEELKTLINANSSEPLSHRYIDNITGGFNEKFTLESLMELKINNIHKFIEFNNITNEEQRLKKFIKEKQDDFGRRKLRYKFKKNLINPMIYIVIEKNVLDNEYEYVENNIMILKKESFNPCCGVISNELELLLKYYEKYLKFIEIIEEYNAKISEINGVLLSSEFVKEYPSENKKIINENQLRYLMKLFQDNKFLFKLLQDNIYNKIMTLINLLIETIEKNKYAISKFLEKRRMEYPQYYIMSDSEMTHLFNYKTDFNFIKRIIKRIYKWIKEIDLTSSLSNSGITGSVIADDYIQILTIDNENIFLRNAKGGKNIKDCVEIIYVELTKKMKEYFKFYKKNYEVIYKPKTTKRINDILKSTINEVENNNALIQQIFICMYYALMDNIEKSLMKTTETFDKLFELYNICKNEITNEIINSVNNKSLKNNKRKYLSLLCLINYFISMLENLIHDDVQLPTDYSFIKYINPKIESDSFFFHLLGNFFTLEYGYEYTGIINNYLMLISNEKMFISFLSAFDFYKKPIILNCNKQYNANENGFVSNLKFDSFNVIGGLLGKYVHEYKCNANMDYNSIFKKFLCVYNKYGPWIKFTNFNILDDFKNFEILANQIIEVYYQIKHSEEEYITFANGNKILLNNKNFNVLLDLTNTDNNCSDKFNLIKNLAKYYKQVNYVEINFEYYIKMSLFNLGIKNFEIASNKILLFINYLFSKLYNSSNSMKKCSHKYFIYNFFNVFLQHIRNCEKYIIISNDNNNIDKEINIICEELNHLLNNLYKSRLEEDVYIDINTNLETIFNFAKIYNSNSHNNKKNEQLEKINDFSFIGDNNIKEAVKKITANYGLSSQSLFINKLYELYSNFENYTTLIIFGDSLSGKTTMKYLLVNLLKQINFANNINKEINTLSIYPNGSPEFFKDFSIDKLFRLYSSDQIYRINTILFNLFENKNKSDILFNIEKLEIKKEKNEEKLANPEKSHVSENSDANEENDYSSKIMNILFFNGEINKIWEQFIQNCECELFVDKNISIKVVDKVIFETNNLRQIDINILTKENYFYMYINNDKNNGLSWENILKKYLDCDSNANKFIFNNNKELIVGYINGLFEKYFPILIDFISLNSNQNAERKPNNNYIIISFIKFFDSFWKIPKFQENSENDEENIEQLKKYILYIFIFSFSWIINNFINYSYKIKIEHIINEAFKADDLKGPVFDYYVNPISLEFDCWTNLIDNNSLLSEKLNIPMKDLSTNPNIIEPLYKEKISLLYIIHNLINNNLCLFLNHLNSSPMTCFINCIKKNPNFKSISYSINSNCNSTKLNEYINDNIYFLHRNIYGDEYGRKTIFFIDDVNCYSIDDNLNNLNDYFYQLLEEKYIYITSKNDFNFLYNFIFIFSNNDYNLNSNKNNLIEYSKNSHFINKVNILNCYINESISLSAIYKPILENKFRKYYLNTFSLLSSQYISVLTKLYCSINDNSKEISSGIFVKKNSNIKFNLIDIDEIIFNISDLFCEEGNLSKFDITMKRYFFYVVSQAISNSLYNFKDVNDFIDVLCNSFNNIFKKDKINSDIIFESNEYLDGKLIDFIFTKINIKELTADNKNMDIYLYEKIDFYKNFLDKKIKDFNNAYSDNYYQELIINDNDYEFIKNIICFYESPFKKILVFHDGKNSFKNLIFKFSSFLCNVKIVECKIEILNKIHLNKIFEECVINNKRTIYFIRESYLLMNKEKCIFYIQDLLTPEIFIKKIDISKYKIEKKEIYNLLQRNLYVGIDFDTGYNKNLDSDNDSIELNTIYENFTTKTKHSSSFIVDKTRVIHKSNWVKNEYKFYLDYFFTKSNSIKSLKQDNNYSEVRQNIFDIIYNTYLFSTELINKNQQNNNNQNQMNLLNNYTETINYFLNKYETNFNSFKEKYLVYEHCNPSEKIIDLMKKLNNEIYKFTDKKAEIEKEENKIKKQKQIVFKEKQEITNQKTDLDNSITIKKTKYQDIKDELAIIEKPILEELDTTIDEILSLTDSTLNEMKMSYEKFNLGKQMLMTIYKYSNNLDNITNSNNYSGINMDSKTISNRKSSGGFNASNSFNESMNNVINLNINNPNNYIILWEITKKNLNTKALNNFFDNKLHINGLIDRSFIKKVEEICNISEFKEIINNPKSEKFKKVPYNTCIKFVNYFNICNNYIKIQPQCNEINKKLDEVKGQLDILMENNREIKNKLLKCKKEASDIESKLQASDRDKNNIALNIKCHNDQIILAKDFDKKLDNIVPLLIQNKKKFYDLLLNYTFYHLFTSLYYSFAPCLDQNQRNLLTKFIYTQISRKTKNKMKEYSFLEICFLLLDYNQSTTNTYSVLSDNIDKNKDKDFFESLAKYYKEIENTNDYICENMFFIEYYSNRSICLQNDKNYGLANDIINNVIKTNQKINLNNIAKKNVQEEDVLKNNINNATANRVTTRNLNTIIKLNNNALHENNNYSRNIVYKENKEYHLINIYINNYQINKDLEYISKLLNDETNKSHKIKILMLFINNCNYENIYLFEELINNSDCKKRSSVFYLGNNKISINTQVSFRIFFNWRNISNDYITNKNLNNSILLNFNINDELLKNEIIFYLSSLEDNKKLMESLNENKIKLVKCYSQRKLIYKKICELINKYDYDTKEESYNKNQKTIDNFHNNVDHLEEVNKSITKINKIIKKIYSNLNHLFLLSEHGSKIFKIIQKYQSNYSFNDFKLLLKNFYQGYKFSEIEKLEGHEKILQYTSDSENIDKKKHEEESENEDEEENEDEYSYVDWIKHVRIYSENCLSLLINYFCEKQLNTFLNDNGSMELIEKIKISLFLLYLLESESKNKEYYSKYSQLLEIVNKILSNQIQNLSQEKSPIESITNENWNKFLFISNSNENKYSEIIKNFIENNKKWQTLLTENSDNEIINELKSILSLSNINNNDNISEKTDNNNSINNNSSVDPQENILLFDILIIIIFITPKRFVSIKNILMNNNFLNEDNICNFFEKNKQFSLSGFLYNLSNSFNSVNSPLLLLERNKINMDRRILYIKTIIYPKLLALIKTSMLKKNTSTTLRRNSTLTVKKLNAHSNNEQNVPHEINNNIAINNIENKTNENIIKFICIKGVSKIHNFDNITQFIKNGGLVVIYNINEMDEWSLKLLFTIIQDAESNNTIDRTFRLVFTLSENIIDNQYINELLFNSCVYYNNNLFSDLFKYSFKSRFLENIKYLNNDLIQFFSSNIFGKKLIVNSIFMQSILNEFSNNKTYYNFVELDDILALSKKYMECNEVDYNNKNEPNATNYFYLIQFTIDNYFCEKFTYNNDQMKIKNYLYEKLLNEDDFMKTNNNLLNFQNGKIIIEDITEFSKNNLINTFEEIPEYKYYEVISEINKNYSDENLFIDNIKKIIPTYIDDNKSNTEKKIKNSFNTVNSRRSISFNQILLEKIPEKINEFIRNLPEKIILNLDEEERDESISKNLFKKDKKGFYLNPLDEVIIYEIQVFNDEIEILNKNLYKLLNELIQKIKNNVLETELLNNSIQNKITFLQQKNEFYKNWLKLGEISVYNLQFITDVIGFFYKLKIKYSKNNNCIKKIFKFSAIKQNENFIELTGLNFNLEKEYDLEIDDSRLSLNKKQGIIFNKLYFGYIEENVVISQNNNINMGENHKNAQDLPLIKDEFPDYLDYDSKSICCNIYQYNGDYVKDYNDIDWNGENVVKINTIKESINVDISSELDQKDMTNIILKGIKIIVNNEHNQIIKDIKI